MLIVASCAVGAYLQVLHAPFVYDDNIYIVQNSKLATLQLSELWSLLVEPYNQFAEFLPLRDLSYWFDITVLGQNPAAFRLHNICLYLLCLPLVFGLTRSTWSYFRPGEVACASWVATAVTVLFALHPSHAEAVTWISGRKDVLAGMFSLLAMWLAMRVKRKQGFALPYVIATLFALLAAMLSKATSVAIAPVVALLWVLFWLDVPQQERRRRLLLWPLAAIVLAGCVALVFASIIKSKVPLYFGIEAVIRTLAVQGWLARLALSAESRHFFNPVFEYMFLSAMVVVGIVVFFSATVGVVMLLRKRSLAGFAVAGFFLICIPNIQLIPYNPPTLVSDRALFVAAWPAMLFVVMLLWKLKPVLRIVMLLAIVSAFFFQSAERSRDWRSFEAVLDADIRAYPGYYMPIFQKVVWVQLPQGMYQDAGVIASSISDPQIRNIAIGLIATQYLLISGTEAAGSKNQAMKLLWKLWSTIEQRPSQLRWNTPMSHVWKLTSDALARYWDVLAKRFPEDALVRYNAGVFLLKIPAYEEDAAPHLMVATQSNQLPLALRGAAFLNLGLALMKSGKVAEAEIPLRAALTQSIPDLRAYCLLVEVYMHTKRTAEAEWARASCRSGVAFGKLGH